MGERVGYVRFSDAGLSPALESASGESADGQLSGVQVDRVFTDGSGGSVERPGLREMMRSVRDGDLVVSQSMDRLARSLDELTRLVLELTGRGVRVQFVREGLTFTAENAAVAGLLLSIVASVANFEGS